MPDASFSFQQVAQTGTPGAIRLRVRNAAATGSLPLDFTAISNQGWLNVAPAQGSLASNETSELWVSANTTGLNSGTYVGTLTITDPDALNSPYEIEFTLQIDTCTETFQVTLAPCTSTIIGAVPTCTSAIQGIVTACTSTIQGAVPACTSAINATGSCPEIVVVDAS